MTDTTPKAVMTPPDIKPHTATAEWQKELARFLLSAGKSREFKDCNLCDTLSQLFDLIACEGEDRRLTEEFIRECFRSAHQAEVTTFMPRLFELVTKRGEMTAAFGVRGADEGRLFLENYLDRPIEDELEAKLGIRPARNKIVEVGNLAAIYPGAVRWLIVALTAELYQEGYEWVVFTGTSELRNGFHRLGLRPTVLAPASIESLPADERARWGSYYDTLPSVMAGNISFGYNEIKHSCQFPKAGITIHPAHSEA
ncbi:MAG: thermostable hemolysin [Nitrosomonadales bacterium]|nr:thermostable hemolysin [Nitrosomonadales bacterium]